MFDSLRTTPALENADPKAGRISEEIVDTLIDNLADVPAQRTTKMQLDQTKQEVTALITSLETYGGNRALLAFANYNGTLGKAIASIPSLENLTEDLSEKMTAKIITDLKALDFNFKFEPDDEAAEEVLLLLPAALIAAHLLIQIVSLAAWVAVIKGIRHWNDARDDKEGRLAKIVKYDYLAEHLEAAADVDRIAHELEALKLPKTEEEHNEFAKHVEGIVTPFAKMGVHVTADGHVTVEAFAKPIKNNIETLGYRENSLVELAEHAEKVKHAAEELKSVNFKAWREEIKKAPKEERHWMSEGYELAADVVHTAVVRVAKVMKLTKHTVNSIKHLYKE